MGSNVLKLNCHGLSQKDLIKKLDSDLDKDINTICLENNYIQKLDTYGIDSTNIFSLSLANNQLTGSSNIEHFSWLKVLNLSSNLIIRLNGIDQLQCLEWFNVSSNQLRNVDILNRCLSLTYLDVSDNQLMELPVLDNLKNLHSLLMHQNLIHELSLVKNYLPCCVKILSLADNEIEDLDEVKHLESLPFLEQLSLVKNSCEAHVVNVGKKITLNYRSYVISLFYNLSILDGVTITPEERSKAEWYAPVSKPDKQLSISQSLGISSFDYNSNKTLHAVESEVHPSDFQVYKIVDDRLTEEQYEVHQNSLADANSVQLLSESEFISGEELPVNYSTHSSQNHLGSAKVHDHFTTSSSLVSDTARSLSPVTKYEEYDRRPIKPLNSAMQSKIFGSSPINKKQGSKSRPPPLKKHSGPTSKYDVTRMRPSSVNTKPISFPTRSTMDLNRKSSACSDTSSQSSCLTLKVANSQDNPDSTKNIVLSEFTHEHHKAAAKIQALWKGYYCRNKDGYVISIRNELRSRRSEQYISLLCSEVQSLKEKLAFEKRLREMQVEALKIMWDHVNELKGENSILPKRKPENGVLTTSNLENNNDMVSIKQTKVDENKENIELKNTVDQLQKQVLQLQEALLSFSDRLVTSESNSNFNIDKVDNDREDLLSVVSASALSVNSTTSHCNDPVTEQYDGLCLESILQSIDSPLSEEEIWSLCEQSIKYLNGLISENSRRNDLPYISLSTTYVNEDGSVYFFDKDAVRDTNYLAPEALECTSEFSAEMCVFGLSVVLWSAADWSLGENQAPSLSGQLEALLISMSHDEILERSNISSVLKACGNYHSMHKRDSRSSSALLYSQANSFSKHSNQAIISNLTNWEEFQSQVKQTFMSSVVPEINTMAVSLKPVSDRQLSPPIKISLSPHEALMASIKQGIKLKKCVLPTLYTVADMYKDNPDLVQSLNVLPGQKRQNTKALRLAMKLKESKAHLSYTAGMPSAPKALRVELRQANINVSNNCSVIVRWSPSYVHDQNGAVSKTHTLLGYRIYVNGQPKGMVTGTKTQALLDGLHFSHEYRIHVRAVSALGESESSNYVIVFVPKSTQATKTKLSHARSSLSTTSLDCKASKQVSEKDVVERVLSRYGIPKASSEHSSKSSLSPGKATSYRSGSCEKGASMDGDSVTQSLNYDSEQSEPTYNSENITPRSKALLEQLKDQLLQQT